VSEGGLGPRSWWYIPESGIHHHSKLTRKGKPGPQSADEQEVSAPVHPTRSRRVTVGNDEGGEPGSGRTQGRTAAAAAGRFIIREAQ